MPECCFNRFPLDQEGAGSAGCTSHPRLAQNKKRHRYAEAPALPAQWFTAYTWSPRCAGLSGHRRLREGASLIPASGDRDNTTSLVRCAITRQVDAATSIAT